MLRELMVYISALDHPYIGSTIVVAILLAPFITRARSRFIRYLRIIAWIMFGIILGIGLANFFALPLLLRS